MIFSAQEEEILKLIAAETKAKIKFVSAREAEQLSHKPLQDEHNAALTALKNEANK